MHNLKGMDYLFLMGHSRSLFLYFHLSTAISKYVEYKILLSTGIEPQTSGIGSNCSANWSIYFWYFLLISSFFSFLTEILLAVNWGMGIKPWVALMLCAFEAVDYWSIWFAWGKNISNQA